eukprot:2759213-Pyramimonas_sp.AAC.1
MFSRGLSADCAAAARVFRVKDLGGSQGHLAVTSRCQALVWNPAALPPPPCWRLIPVAPIRFIALPARA